MEEKKETVQKPPDELIGFFRANSGIQQTNVKQTGRSPSVNISKHYEQVSSKDLINRLRENHPPKPVPVPMKKVDDDTPIVQVVKAYEYSVEVPKCGVESRNEFANPIFLPTKCEQEELVQNTTLNNVDAEKTNDTFILPLIRQVVYCSDPLKFQQYKRSNNKFKTYLGLEFDSDFECGNLYLAESVMSKTVSVDTAEEYHLYLQSDVVCDSVSSDSSGASTGDRAQWYFFRIRNTRRRTYKFNICNLHPSTALYNKGMRPVMISEQDYKSKAVGWTRAGQNVTYSRNSLDRSGKESYTLSFTLNLDYSKDTVYLAYSVPYTYTQMQSMVYNLLHNPAMRSLLEVQTLCRTPAGNRCDMLIITENKERFKQKGATEVAVDGRSRVYSAVSSDGGAFNSISTDSFDCGPVSEGDGTSGDGDAAQHRMLAKMQKKHEKEMQLQEKRKVRKSMKEIVFICARSRPGDAVSSWMMEGVIKFLLSSSESAVCLRKAFVFYVIPMMCIDGTVNGNYLLDSACGNDLAKQWSAPDETLQPTVYHVKQLLTRLQLEGDNVISFLDLQGHSGKEGIFFRSVLPAAASPESNDHSGRNQQSVLDVNEKLQRDPRSLYFAVAKRTKLLALRRCSLVVKANNTHCSRVVLRGELRIPLSVTVFASAYKGPSSNRDDQLNKSHFLPADYAKFGCSICLALADLFEVRKSTDPTQQLASTTRISALQNSSFSSSANRVLDVINNLASTSFDSGDQPFDPSSNLEYHHEKARQQKQRKAQALRASLNLTSSMSLGTAAFTAMNLALCDKTKTTFTIGSSERTKKEIQTSQAVPISGNLDVATGDTSTNSEHQTTATEAPIPLHSTAASLAATVRDSNFYFSDEEVVTAEDASERVEASINFNEAMWERDSDGSGGEEEDSRLIQKRRDIAATGIAVEQQTKTDIKPPHTSDEDPRILVQMPSTACFHPRVLKSNHYFTPRVIYVPPYEEESVDDMPSVLEIVSTDDSAANNFLSADIFDGNTNSPARPHTVGFDLQTDSEYESSICSLSGVRVSTGRHSGAENGVITVQFTRKSDRNALMGKSLGNQKGDVQFTVLSHAEQRAQLEQRRMKMNATTFGEIDEPYNPRPSSSPRNVSRENKSEIPYIRPKTSSNSDYHFYRQLSSRNKGIYNASTSPTRTFGKGDRLRAVSSESMAESVAAIKPLTPRARTPKEMRNSLCSPRRGSISYDDAEDEEWKKHTLAIDTQNLVDSEDNLLFTDSTAGGGQREAVSPFAELDQHEAVRPRTVSASTTMNNHPELNGLLHAGLSYVSEEDSTEFGNGLIHRSTVSNSHHDTRSMHHTSPLSGKKKKERVKTELEEMQTQFLYEMGLDFDYLFNNNAGINAAGGGTNSGMGKEKYQRNNKTLQTDSVSSFHSTKQTSTHIGTQQKSRMTDTHTMFSANPNHVGEYSKAFPLRKVMYDDALTLTASDSVVTGGVRGVSTITPFESSDSVVRHKLNTFYRHIEQSLQERHLVDDDTRELTTQRVFAVVNGIRVNREEHFRALRVAQSIRQQSDHNDSKRRAAIARVSSVYARHVSKVEGIPHDARKVLPAADTTVLGPDTTMRPENRGDILERFHRVVFSNSKKQKQNSSRVLESREYDTHTMDEWNWLTNENEVVNEVVDEPVDVMSVSSTEREDRQHITPTEMLPTVEQPSVTLNLEESRIVSSPVTVPETVTEIEVSTEKKAVTINSTHILPRVLQVHESLSDASLVLPHVSQELSLVTAGSTAATSRVLAPGIQSMNDSSTLLEQLINTHSVAHSAATSGVKIPVLSIHQIEVPRIVYRESAVTNSPRQLVSPRPVPVEVFAERKQQSNTSPLTKNNTSGLVVGGIRKVALLSTPTREAAAGQRGRSDKGSMSRRAKTPERVPQFSLLPQTVGMHSPAQNSYHSPESNARTFLPQVITVAAQERSVTPHTAYLPYNQVLDANSRSNSASGKKDGVMSPPVKNTISQQSAVRLMNAYSDDLEEEEEDKGVQQEVNVTQIDTHHSNIAAEPVSPPSLITLTSPPLTPHRPESSKKSGGSYYRRSVNNSTQ